VEQPRGYRVAPLRRISTATARVATQRSRVGN